MPGILSIGNLNRRTIKAPVNPMDKSTIASIFPKELNEVKETISPGKFTIQAGTYEKPSILVIGPSSWWREIDEKQPLLEITNSSVQVAESIVKDYCKGLLAYNAADSMPGIFWVPGEFTMSALKDKFSSLLNKAQANQKNWYANLVRMGDSLWSASNGNPLVISQDMRMAASELGLNKDWTKDFALIQRIPCVACGTPRNAAFPICPACHAVVDKELATKLGISFSKS